jgi:hypothetical protein
MRTLTLDELNKLRYAAEDMLLYLGDNSCSDPDCCGGPYYTVEEFNEGRKVLNQLGLDYDHERV